MQSSTLYHPSSAKRFAESLRRAYRTEEIELYLNRPRVEDFTAELGKCKADVKYWVNRHCWTYDPRLKNPYLRFRLFAKQEELLTWLAEREEAEEPGIIEKSRDEGVTYLCAAYAMHGWLFRTGFSAGFGSRKLELVDKIGDPDCIFEKIRIMLYRLPEWMIPNGFKRTEHDNRCKIINPENGATITGEGGDDIGRGGRKSIYFVDEAAFLEHPDSIERSLSNTTNVRIDVSTPNGPGNPFATRRQSGKFPVFTLHWKDDPRKNHTSVVDGKTVYPWYEKQKREKDPVTIAQEIDIDYTASVEGICIPAQWVRAAVGLKLPESEGPIIAGLDIAEEGTNKSVLITRQGARVRDVVHWSKLNTTQTAWRAREEGEKHGVSTLNYDVVGVGLGVKGSFESSDKPLPFSAVPVNWGNPPTNDKWPDGRRSVEMFLNLRAELWWKLRRRFERSYEYAELGVQHPPEDMISIPNSPDLISDLSLPLWERTEQGKIRLESKDAMQRRGVKSPDFGDALAYSFAPVKRSIKAV